MANLEMTAISYSKTTTGIVCLRQEFRRQGLSVVPFLPEKPSALRMHYFDQFQLSLMRTEGANYPQVKRPHSGGMELLLEAVAALPSTHSRARLCSHGSNLSRASILKCTQRTNSSEPNHIVFTRSSN